MYSVESAWKAETE